MSDYVNELAIESALVMHVEQITGGAAVECHCGKNAVLHITSEPDMEPGPVCAEHGHEWIDMTVALLRRLFPA